MASNSTNFITFGADDLTITFDGYEIKNIGPDGVTIARAEDMAIIERGIYKDSLSVSRNLHTDGTMSISVMTFSDDDNVLTQLFSLDELRVFQVTINVKDQPYKLISNAWMMTQPDFVVNQQAPARTYVIGLQSATFNLVSSATSFISSITSAI